MKTMQTMTAVERISNILKRQPVDRIGVFEHFWGDTQRNWEASGYLEPGESLENRFGLDLQVFWPFNFTADLDFEPQILEETEDTVLTRDGNGALLRRFKDHETTPEHLDFLVKDRQGWEQHARPHLTTERRRIDFEGYRRARQEAAAHQRFFCWSGVNVFELMHPVCGHVYMLEGMALDPDWVKDMVDVYSRMTIEHWEILFAEEGYPDGIWFYEDMGFKNHPFISPRMYQEIIQPAHARTIRWAHERGLPVIMHSCGYVAPLVPGMVAAGIDCLQVIEVKAGMDLIGLYRDFGEVLSFMGGIDVRVLYTNDRAIINLELESKIPAVMKKFGYVLHSDHSIPSDVHPENYEYFIQRGLELGTYS
jgi:uroporphyrinogen decarboxylase